MTDINLLPKEHSKAYQREIFFFLARDIILISFITTIVITILILMSHLILKKDILKVTQNIEAIEQKNQSISHEITSINTLTRDISDITALWHPLYTILEALSEYAGPGITFDSLKINTDDDTLALTGHAATRDELLTFNTTLEQSDFFESIESPLSNILQPTNITFRITASLSQQHEQ